MFIARAGTSSKQLGAASSVMQRQAETFIPVPGSINIALLTELEQSPPDCGQVPVAVFVTYCLLPVSLAIALRNSSGLIRPKCLKTTLPSLS